MLRRCFVRLNASAPPTEVKDVLTTIAQTPALAGWEYRPMGTRAFLRKVYTFKDFHSAWKFMSGCVPLINEIDHHPEWVNVYNKVDVSLTTHDLRNQVSDRDVAIATKMNEVAEEVKKGE